MVVDLFGTKFSAYTYTSLDKHSPPNSLFFTSNKSLCHISQEVKQGAGSQINSLVDLPFLSELHSPEITDKLKSNILKLLEVRTKSDQTYHNSRLTKLPGPLPVTLTRNKLKACRTKTYWITEKSDGERCIMLIKKDKAYLIDRSFIFYKINSDFYSKNLWKTGDILVDGEIIFKPMQIRKNAENDMYKFLRNRPIFFIFDIIQFDGLAVFKKQLLERLHFIRSLNIVYRKYSNEPHPLALLAKTFYPFKEIRNITKNIVFDPEKEVYVFHDHKKNIANYNDGLIFTPQSEEYLQKGNFLFKWKWPKLNTFDLRVEKPFFDSKNFLKVFCGGHDYESIFVKNIGPFLNEDKETLLKRFKTAEKDYCIIECGFSRNKLGHSVWSIHRIRHERKIPNHVSTVLRTMEVMIDGVDINEIIRAFIM